MACQLKRWCTDETEIDWHRQQQKQMKPSLWQKSIDILVWFFSGHQQTKSRLNCQYFPPFSAILHFRLFFWVIKSQCHVLMMMIIIWGWIAKHNCPNAEIETLLLFHYAQTEAAILECFNGLLNEKKRGTLNELSHRAHICQ